MNKITITMMSTAAAYLLVAACAPKPAGQVAAAAASAPATGSSVFEVMNASIIPRSNLVWELSGKLYDDKGNLDAKQLTDAEWMQVKDGAAEISKSAQALAAATGIKSAPAGTKILNEGTAGSFGAAEVQAAINADPKAFSDHAAKLVAVADEIVAAATAHDAKKADDAQSRMTDVCGACHQKFWYPNQPAQ
ncbi:MAG: cytochrome c [Pseudomonadota bacterium]